MIASDPGTSASPEATDSAVAAEPQAPIAPLPEEPTPPVALPRPPEGQRIIALGGGKGGAGRTVLTANLGILLAQLGKKVVIVDAALGNANLHTCFAMELPALRIGDVLSGRVRRLEDAAMPTGVAGLSIVCGSVDYGAAKLKHLQKLRLMERMRLVEGDFILLDLPGGMGQNALDLFLAADLGLVVVVPEPTSIECAYRFLQSAFLRDLHGPGVHEGETPEIRRILELASKRGGELPSPLDLALRVEAQDEGAGSFLRGRMRSFRPTVLLNQARTTADGRLLDAMRSVSRRRFGIHIDLLGPIDYDDSVWVSVRRRLPLILEYPDSAATKAIGNVARKLVAAQAPVRRELAAPGTS
jgi:flagellar biosynthesis protein FlhG